MNNYSLSDDSILDLRSIEVSKRKYKEEIKSTINTHQKLRKGKRQATI